MNYRSAVFVVIPAYNEGRVITRTVQELIPYGYTLVVVDDGSRLPAERFLAGLSVHYLRHSDNLGQGAALQTGMEYALSKGAEIIVHFDADGQHSPALIDRLIEPIASNKYDVALASRFINADDRRQVPAQKRLLLKLGVVVSWIFTGVWLTDTHNGFRALSRTAANKIRLTENGFAHATEILGLIRHSRLRYCEVPATIRYTDYSKAKGQTCWNSINIVVDLLLNKLAK